MTLAQNRQRTRNGYSDTLVYKISYKKGETVTEFYPGTVYHLRRRNFRVETSQITGEEFLVAKRAFAWKFTYKQCPTCFSQMCEPFISTGSHSWYRS
jgi:hypothetical protein